MKVKNKSMLRRIIMVGILLLILYIPTWFVYTRFFLDKYEMKDNTLKLNNIVYVRKDSFSDTDDDNLGKAIGVGVYGKRKIADLIWPFWVMEYKNDKEHNRIFVRGLMDVGSVYEKASN